MKTFNGVKINRSEPQINQVYLVVKYNKLIKVEAITEDKSQAICIDEFGNKYWVGFNWFDGDSYILLGTV